MNRQIDCKGKILDLNSPAVMGILNVTPDSFYDGGQYEKETDILRKAETMINEGADVIDIGAVSTRPGAPVIPEKEERQRLMKAITVVSMKFPEIIISVDTFHSTIAEEALGSGAHMINDISAGQYDENMFETIARLGVPYIMMHIKGTPQNMQNNPTYTNMLEEVHTYFTDRITHLAKLKFDNIIIDPGFGFGKTVEHNYRLLQKLDKFAGLDFPLLAGLSRKSMINKVLKTKPENALNGTTVVNTIALLKGAHILRVHDVKEAREAIKIVQAYNEQGF
ncbi:MAG: dihydropteroate synthase [Bacteroidales bacterium]|nr:dihydropteroate synthase [Bacteroidales bacterium]